LAILIVEARSSKLGNRVWIIQFLEELSCVLASKWWPIWRKQPVVSFIDLFNILEICYYWFFVCKEISVERLDLDLIMETFIWAYIRFIVVHFGHWLVFFALGSCNSLEIVLGLFHICLDLLVFVELFKFLLLHLLFEELLLLGKCKLFVCSASIITKGTMGICWCSDKLFKVWSRWWWGSIVECYLATLSNIELNMFLWIFMWTQFTNI